MRNWKSIAIVAAALLVVTWGILALGKLTLIRYTGKKVSAIVTGLPEKCDKYNEIDVLIGNTAGTLSISRKECNEGKYRVGQIVEVIQKEGYSELVWPGSHHGLVIILIIGVLVIVYFSEKNKFKKIA